MPASNPIPLSPDCVYDVLSALSGVMAAWHQHAPAGAEMPEQIKACDTALTQLNKELQPNQVSKKAGVRSTDLTEGLLFSRPSPGKR